MLSRVNAETGAIAWRGSAVPSRVEEKSAFSTMEYHANRSLSRISEARADYQQALVLAQEARDEKLVAKVKDALERRPVIRSWS